MHACAAAMHFSKLLVYGTAGVAFGDVEYSTSESDGIAFDEPDDDLLDGVQFGVGLLWHLSRRVRVAFEYLQTSLDDGDHLYRVLALDARRSEDHVELSSLRAMFTYRVGELNRRRE